LDFLQVVPTPLSKEIFFIYKLNFLFFCKLFGTITNHHYVRRLFHYHTSKRDRIFDMMKPGDGPAANVFPSMIEASSSFLPSAVKTAPFPALNNGESSRMRIAISTASMLVFPACS